jgi:2-polyprenyl-6-methoxyphenol hydroxylase-like FAD-dependent oxidoreductase
MPGAEALNVSVVGGSIGGLCAGVALRGLGADVHVYESQAGPMDTRGAGIVVQDELLTLLRQHGAPELPTTACRFRRYLDPAGGNGRIQPLPQRFTSWEAIYKTLRAVFPQARYHMGAHVKSFEQIGDRITADVDGHGAIESDLLVCADGANSASRRRLLPDVEPRYAGYIAWRGTLDEADAPKHLVAFFDDGFTFSEARSGGHILAYLIPGDNADPRPGRRRLNWVWYVGASEETLKSLLVDRHGHQHRGSLPQGLAPDRVIRALCARARREVHPRLAELVAATPDPFIQTIVDVTVPQTVFGRVILLGDAAFVVRPHTAAATAKAAHDAMALATSLRAAQDLDTGLQRAQALQIELGRRLTQYGVALGDRGARGS